MFQALLSRYLKVPRQSAVEKNSATKETARESSDIHHDVERYIALILRIYGDLSTLNDLKPCEKVNALFGELVSLCIKTLNEQTTRRIIEDPRVQAIIADLRIICSDAECELEAYWAERIVAASDEKRVYENLTSFPYYTNYVDLTRMELAAIQSVSSAWPERIAFLGSGPMPLTSLCLLEALSQQKKASQIAMKGELSPPPSPVPVEPVILNIDHSSSAITQSAELCHALGPRARGMHFICQSAGSSYDLRDCDVVYFAALVGTTQKDKEQLLLEVVSRMSVGSLLVVRSAHSLRKLLYPEFDATSEAILKVLDIMLVVHPYNHVVNSVIVGKVKGPK